MHRVLIVAASVTADRDGYDYGCDLDDVDALGDDAGMYNTTTL
jgi:hypothetical protein